MNYVSPSYKLNIINNEKFKKLDFAARRIIEEIGMVIGSDKVRSRLLDEGAKERGPYIHIPSEMVDKALSTVPSGFKLYSVNGDLAMDVNKKNKYFGGSVSSLGYIDPISGKKIAHTMKTSSDLSKVVDALPNMDYLANNGLVSDVDPKIAGRLNFSNTLRYTTKPMYISVDYVESYKDIISLCQDLSGGKDNFKHKPFIFGYCEPVPPFNHSGDSLEKLITCGDAGIPVVYMPYCMRGGTAPITLEAALAQSFAEILSGLVVHQLFNPGSPYIVGCMPTVLDMKTTTGSYGAPEFHFGIAVSAEICDYYNLPFFGTAGCTDSQQLDMQTATEVTMALMSSILSGADIIHDLGVMQHASAISPELYVYTNEVLDMLRVYQGGIDFSDEALMFDVIKKIGPKGHYLEESSTLKNFKSIWYSKIFDRSLNVELPADEFLRRIKSKTIKLIEGDINKNINNDILPIIEEHEQKWKRLIK